MCFDETATPAAARATLDNQVVALDNRGDAIREQARGRRREAVRIP